MSEIKICNGYNCKCTSDECTCSVNCVHGLWINGNRMNKMCPCSDCYQFQAYFRNEINMPTTKLLQFIQFQPIPSTELILNNNNNTIINKTEECINYDILKIWILEINQGLQRITNFPYSYCTNSKDFTTMKALEEIFSTVYKTKYIYDIFVILGAH